MNAVLHYHRGNISRALFELFPEVNFENRIWPKCMTSPLFLAFSPFFSPPFFPFFFFLLFFFYLFRFFFWKSLKFGNRIFAWKSKTTSLRALVRPFLPLLPFSPLSPSPPLPCCSQEWFCMCKPRELISKLTKLN